MKAKAIGDLVQLKDADLFAAVSEGLGHIHHNMRELEKDARLLHKQKRERTHRVVLGVAEEEAAKFLILLDAIRCPRNPQDQFARQLRRFNDHLAKGLYAKACSWALANFGNLVDYTACERPSLYLDGPNDVDFMYRNQVVDSRERRLYVDYIYVDEDAGHIWDYPELRSHWDLGVRLPYCRPKVISIVDALHKLGATSPEALSLVAEIWRSRRWKREDTWRDLAELNLRTLRELNEAGLLAQRADDDTVSNDDTVSTVVEGWIFPMHTVELSMIEVKPGELRQVQEDWYFREMGIYAEDY